MFVKKRWLSTFDSHQKRTDDPPLSNTLQQNTKDFSFIFWRNFYVVIRYATLWTVVLDLVVRFQGVFNGHTVGQRVYDRLLSESLTGNYSFFFLTEGLTVINNKNDNDIYIIDEHFRGFILHLTPSGIIQIELGHCYTTILTITRLYIYM